MHGTKLCRSNLHRGSFIPIFQGLVIGVLLTCTNALPSFLSSSYATTVSELTPVGTILINVTAVPGTAGNTLTYNIFNNPSILDIDIITGSVILVGSLDYELDTVHQFNVEVFEGSDAAMTHVTVNVLNENDNPLTCAHTLIVQSITEGPTSLSIPLSCIDRDQPTPDSISYHIQSVSNASLFNIDSSAGIIYIIGSLDYEQEIHHEVIVNVTSGENDGILTPDRILLVTILIIVEPVNEFSPIFDEANITLSISEDTAIGSIIGIVNASDADEGYDGELSFSLMSEAVQSMFIIDSMTGQVILLEALDYEQAEFHELTVILSDNSPVESRLSTTTTVMINVENINEYTPEFSQQVYSVSILETHDLGGDIGILLCTDDDSDSLFTYSLLPGNNTNHFTIDPSEGIVMLTSMVEFDSNLLSPFHLTVQCTDSGTPSKSPQAILLVTVVGVNRDLPPSVNSTEYKVNLSETTSPGAVVLESLLSVVTDSNRGLAGPLEFSLVYSATCPQEMFHIDSVSGALYTVGYLDYETSSEHNCVVSVANTESTVSAEIDITVSVTNANDEVPLCSQTLYTVTVSEDSIIGSDVLNLSCSDADGDNLEYTIVGGSTVFQLTQSDTHMITLSQMAPVDLDTFSTHNIHINISDGKHSSQLAVFVYIEPVNEHVPVFNQSMYNCSVSEKASIGSVLCTVIAEDDDTGADGNITYSISNGNEQNTFAIDSISGGLVLAGFIDYELVQEYLIVIEASDNGQSPHTTSVQVRITVLDSNDNAPIISPLITSTITENAPVGSVVTALECSDADSGINGDVTLTIESQMNAVGNSTAVFTIDYSTNDLITNTAIDYESSHFYTIIVTCKDNGSIASSMVVVDVSPLNEFAPVLDQVDYSLTISENTTVGTSLLQVIAIDSDKGLDGHVLYTIEPEESGREFLQISETSGLIITQQLLNCDWGLQHNFTITATDMGTPAISNQSLLHITFNNCLLGQLKPQDVVYFANVTENSPVNTEVTRVACDYDRIFNQGSSALEYSIISPTTSPFQVDSTNGVISIAIPPDYEQSTSYMLHIGCSDSSDLQSNISFSVNVEIIPQNEYPPRFTFEVYTAVIAEDVSPGTSVIRVNASDDDTGNDGSVVYSIQESMQLFVVDSRTGDIYTGGSLDREMNSVHTFHVVALDQMAHGESVLSSVTEIRVDVADTNDNPPQCDRIVYHVSISPLVNVGHRVIEPECTDDDTGFNSQLTYTLHTDSSDMFDLDEETGVLSLANKFTATSSLIHEMVITVEDGGMPSLSTAVLVIVELESDSVVSNDESLAGDDASPIVVEGSKNAVNFTVMDMSVELWNEGGMKSFKSAMAHSITSYCALLPEACSLLSGCAHFYRQKRSTIDEYFIAVFSDKDVVLLPSNVQSTQEFVTSDGTTHLNITFYITLPEETQKTDYRTTDYVVPRTTLSLLLRDEGTVIESQVRDSVSPSLTLEVSSSGDDTLCWVWGMIVSVVVSIESCLLIAIIFHYGIRKWKSIKKGGVIFPLGVLVTEESTDVHSSQFHDIRGNKKDVSIKKSKRISLSELANDRTNGPMTRVNNKEEDSFNDDISTIDLMDDGSNKTSLQGQPRSRDSSAAVSGNSLGSSEPQPSSNSQDSLGDYKENFPYEPPRGGQSVFQHDRHQFKSKAFS